MTVVGILGDVDGHIYHALGVLLTWQHTTDRRLDVIVQLGNMSAFPSAQAALNASFNDTFQRFPHQLDFARLPEVTEPLASILTRVREVLGGPVMFVRGTFEDFDWLDELSRGGSGPVPVDAFGLFHYVPDGTVLSFGLNSVVAHFRQSSPHVMPGALAVLDLEAESVEVVDADWLADIPKLGFDFVDYVRSRRMI